MRITRQAGRSRTWIIAYQIARECRLKADHTVWPGLPEGTKAALASVGYKLTVPCRMNVCLSVRRPRMSIACDAVHHLAPIRNADKREAPGPRSSVRQAGGAPAAIDEVRTRFRLDGSPAANGRRRAAA